MNKKIINKLVVFLFGFFLIPNIASAISIKQTSIWTSSSRLNLSSQSYYTYKYDNNPRSTGNIGGWKLYQNDTATGDRVFCVEPGKKFPSDKTVEGYSAQSTPPSDTTWDIKGDVTNLNRAMSCWSGNDYSIVSMQAIAWELVTEERSSIDETAILKNSNFKPYRSNGTSYSNDNGVTTLYERITDHTNIFNAYKSILRCAARFKVHVSFAYSSDSNAKSSPLKLTSYDDSTQTFSRTFTHSSNIEPNLLKYYTVSSSDSNVKVSKTNTSITVTTKKEYSKEDPVKITLNYTYKDDGTSKLNTYTPTFYVKDSYQTLYKGSTTKTMYIYVYTGSKPKYQLKLHKQDENGTAMSGVKFNVYSDAKATNKIGTTTETNSSGDATLTGITKIGKYYAKEVSTPDGYVTNNQVVTIDVKAENKEGTNSYATGNKSFVNTHMKFTLYKRTINDEGKTIDITDYTGSGCTGDFIGPEFTIEKDNKKLCFKQNGSAGKYVITSCSTSGATETIRTCTGKFDIIGITAGCYNINEITAPKGYQLPNAVTKKVCVTKGVNPGIESMYNGVTGVVFNKVSENGVMLDGGKYTLQKKVNGVYRDVLLKHETGAIYSYSTSLKEDDEANSYVLDTVNGTINVKNLEPGEYRFVEKQAPEGYEAIKEKDSTATFTISDKSTDNKTDFYQVKLVNQKVRVKGSSDSAELIVTITTGRKVANYALIIGSLALLLVIFIIIRKKTRK